MKHILIYYPANKFSMTDFGKVDYSKIPDIVKAEFNGNFPNVGNKVWLQAIVSAIHSENTVYDFGYEDISEDEINEKYDCVLMPLANCFHTGWIQYMERRASHLKNIKIPVYVIACGVQAKSYDDINTLVESVREPATKFIKSVYNTGGEFALRGYFTAEFFERLGFKSAVVTGCPSLYQMGRSLSISDNKVDKTAFKATVNGDFKLPISQSDYDICDFIDQGSYGNMLFDREYFNSNSFDIKKIIKYAKEGKMAELNAIAEQRIRLFADTREWMSYFVQNNISFSFGSRIHGTVMPLLSGVPSLIYSRNARTREMAEFFNIPCILEQEDKSVHSLYDLYCSVDYSAFNRDFAQHYDYFENFLIKCGLVEKANGNNIFMQMDANVPLPQSVNTKYFENIKRNTTLLSPALKAVSALSNKNRG